MRKEEDEVDEEAAHANADNNVEMLTMIMMVVHVSMLLHAFWITLATYLPTLFSYLERLLKLIAFCCEEMKTREM